MVNLSQDKLAKIIKIVYIILIILTLIMISIGGVTRLTGSGLSITSWKLITGIIPPLNYFEWQKEFMEYQRFPEYQILNQNMTLNQFKTIFYFEYFHRLLGRIIGLFTFLLIVLTFIKKASLQDKIYSVLLFLLVSLQGAVGWYMVKSGLINVPKVSHFRLLLHFTLAILFLTLLYKGLFKLIHSESFNAKLKDIADLIKPNKLFLLNFLTKISLVLLIAQLGYGALLAGLDAGLVSTSYPKMFGEWLPPNLMLYPGTISTKLFSNPVFINFFHRHLGILTALIIFITGFMCLIYPTRKWYLTLSLGLSLILLAIIQPLIGIMTLVLQVPIGLGAIHQFVAVVLWSSLFYFYLVLKEIKQKSLLLKSNATIN